MSDFQQDPQWWQASDGKWYPPQTHPSASPTLPNPAVAAPTLPNHASAPVGQHAATTSKARKPVWRRWWAIALGAFLLLIVISAIVAPPAEDEAAGNAPPGTATRPEPAASTDLEGTAPVAVESTLPEPPPTDLESTAPAAVESTLPEPPTTAAPATTGYVLSPDDVRSFAFPISFDSSRDDVLEILNDLTVVQSVDQYTYDTDTGTVLLDVTPAFDFDEGVRDDAWAIMRAKSALWTGAWYDSNTGWSPALDVSISTAQYACNGEQMRAMADSRFSRADWEAACRIR